MKQSCYLCGSQKIGLRKGEVRDNTNLKILSCQDCGLVFLSSFEHINENYYRESGMNRPGPNIGTWMHETERDDQRRFEYCRELIRNKNLFDVGSGNGGFLIKSRSLAEFACGMDPDQSLIPHYQNLNIPFFQSISEIKGSFNIITLFHVLEHMKDPRATLLELKPLLEEKGEILIEVPNSNDALITLYECQPFSKFTYWSCHLFLFSFTTLERLFGQIGAKIEYIRHIQRYPLSNHLYWLSRGKPGGHTSWSFLDTPNLFEQYEKQLASLGKTDTLIASISF